VSSGENVRDNNSKGFIMSNCQNATVEISTRNFKKSLLTLSIMAIGSPVLAQTNIDEAPLDEVVVIGMKSSLNSAQEIKRNADTVKDVITASDIGALPDKSVTEALQRVAGVTVERFAASDDPNHFADEGSGVLIRGLDRVRSEINGRDSFSASATGGLNFEDIPPELLASVEVVKNQTADLIAGGIAGTVNLITRKPFDAADRIVMLSAKTSYGDFREAYSPSYTGLFSDRWETAAGEFGALISVTQTEFKSRGDGIGVANYYSRGTAEGLDGPAINDQLADTVVYMPGQFSLRTANNDRERLGLAGSLQWQNANENVIATLEYIKSDASLTWRERVVGTQEQGFVAPIHNHANIVSGTPATFDSDGFFTSGTYTGAAMHTLLSSRFNNTNDIIEDTSFKLELFPTDSLKIDIDYQHIETSQRVKNYSVNGQARAAVSNALVDLRGSLPKITYITPNFTAPTVGIDAADIFIYSGLDQDVDSDGTEDALKLDLEYSLDGNWFKGVKAGVFYSDKELIIRDTEYSNWGALNRAWVGADVPPSAPINVPDEWERVDFNDFYKSKGLVGGNTNFFFPRMSNAEHFVEFTRRGCGDFLVAEFGGGSGTGSQKNPNCYSAQIDLSDRIPGTPFAPHHVTSTNEARTEAYIRFDFANDELAKPVRGNLGLRYVNYQLESTGFTLLPAPVPGPAGVIFAQQYPNIAALTTSEGGQIQTVKGTDYSTVLPSFNLAVNLSDDVIARVGVSKGLFFPNLNQTRNSKVTSINVTNIGLDPNKPIDENPGSPTYNPVANVEDVQLNGIARNPFLKPEESLNFDLSAEWYFATAGSLTGSIFKKEIDNLFRDRSFLADVSNIQTGAKEQFTFVGPANDGSGSIQGFELAYSQFYDFLPGAFSGLGLQLNYTYIDQKDLNDPAASGVAAIRFDSNGTRLNDDRATFRQFTNLPLPGYSDENYNIIGMYEYNDISLRLAYTWRSEYLTTRRDSNEFAPVYTDAAGYLDATFFYTINDNIKIGFEATNLLDTETKTRLQLNQAGKKTDSLNFITDKRYAISVRANF
jgi:iron complex outermembrane receptor protein